MREICEVLSLILLIRWMVTLRISFQAKYQMRQETDFIVHQLHQKIIC